MIFSPHETNPRKPRMAAYVDEGCIFSSRLTAMGKKRVKGTLKRRLNKPYIVGVLIALAQATYEGKDVRHIEVSLLRPSCICSPPC